MFKLIYTNRFSKDIKLLQRRGCKMELLKGAIIELEKTGTLPIKNQPHKLSGNYNDIWEAHLKPDWLILWKVNPGSNEVWLIRSGTHSDLF